MCRTPFLLAVAAALWLFPAQLFAGGPPWLSLPLDGVTADNADACAALLAAKLEDKIWPRSGQFSGLKIVPQGDQWYLTFYMGRDVALHDVDVALNGSDFSVPCDKLRLFGHVTLEIDARTTKPKQLIADLEALEHVSVAASENKERLLVTVDMPYPVEDGRPYRESVGWDKFQRNDRSSEPLTKSESPATSRTLPGYDTFRNLLAKHSASLKDLRWRTQYACRPLGGVVAPEPDAVVSAVSAKQPHPSPPSEND